MSLWKVEVYLDKDDISPFKIGYLNAEGEQAAIEAATSAMDEAERADLKIVAQIVSTLPPMEVLWVPRDA